MSRRAEGGDTTRSALVVGGPSNVWIEINLLPLMFRTVTPSTFMVRSELALALALQAPSADMRRVWCRGCDRWSSNVLAKLVTLASFVTLLLGVGITPPPSSPALWR
jgi:hypothetical protein